ncbi:putative uncharacterized protein [Vibrio anguillarum]|nr:putative uncharacterized protein [Vibrio anguillarum]
MPHDLSWSLNSLQHSCENQPYPSNKLQSIQPKLHTNLTH